jgi:hypothetical protein
MIHLSVNIRTLCEICGIAGVYDSVIYSNYSNKRFNILRCDECNFGWIANPNLDFQKIYSEDYYNGTGADASVHYYEEKNNPESVYFKIREIEFQGFLSMIRKLPLLEEIKVLDYGGGLGTFADYLNRHGVKCKLFEPDNHDDVIGTIAENPSKKFNVITMIEVLEHLNEPNKTLSEVSHLLDEGGYLIVTTGNLQSRPGLISEWSYIRNNSDVHITYWSKNSLDLALGKLGLTNVSQRIDRQVIIFKIFKGLCSLTPAKHHSLFLKLIRFKLVFYPFVRLVDRKFLISEFYLYRKI